MVAGWSDPAYSKQGNFVTQGSESIFKAVGSLLFSEGLAKILPASPAAVLTLGDFPTVLGEILREQGFVLTHLDWRDAASQEHPSAGPSGELKLVKLDVPAGQQFEAVLAFDLEEDIHPLALFDGLNRLLSPGGVVVLSGPASVGSWLDYISEIGERCGFVVVEHDIETQASGFVRVVRRATHPPRWRVGNVLQSDFPEIAKLFQEVFGHPMSRALWDWKYGSRRGNAVLARKDGVVVAHYGGMYRDIVVGGQRDRVAQICDVMVQSQERGVLTRQGPFFLMGSSWPEIYGPKGFGFPTTRAMRVAEKMGLYIEAGRLTEVRWTPSSPGMRLRTRVRVIDRNGKGDQELVRSLWNSMSDDLKQGVVGVRNWPYLERRYFTHPSNQYEVLVVCSRFSRRPLGIVVLRKLEGSCELVDVIAPLANLNAIIDQARRLTALWSIPYLYCWITTNYAPLFLQCEGKAEPLDIAIPASSWTKNPQSELFVGKWWLMSGDTDFR
jgi:hypothetical protein